MDDLFAARTLACVIKLRQGHTGLGSALNLKGTLFIGRLCEVTDTPKRVSCDHRDRDWSDATTSQGNPEIAGHRQEPGERHGKDLASGTLERLNPANTLFNF